MYTASPLCSRRGTVTAKRARRSLQGAGVVVTVARTYMWYPVCARRCTRLAIPAYVHIPPTCLILSLLESQNVPSFLIE